MKYPTLLDRFLVYVKENTRSDESSTTTPSTYNQVEFAQNILLPEMKRIGLQNVHYLPNGFAVGTLPATDPSLTRKIGFIAHMDTADFNAEGVNPQIIENYDGNPIALGTSGYELHPKDFPQLANYQGQTLITTDGTTLLGSDDKSGIAEIMTAIEYLVQNPDIKHCEIRVGFGPDEEIGVGADKFDVEDFDVDFAYTMDGGPLGELQYETFSAAAAKVDFLGRNVHPGSAKDQMINAFQLAIDFHNALPEEDRPEKTEGYQGFFHLMNMEGSVDTASTSYIIRDFEEKDFKARKQLMLDIAEEMNANFDTPRVIVHLHDQYY
ncbi:MAG: peptidase T, partial [Streptococcus suis]